MQLKTIIKRIAGSIIVVIILYWLSHYPMFRIALPILAMLGIFGIVVGFAAVLIVDVFNWLFNNK